MKDVEIEREKIKRVFKVRELISIEILASVDENSSTVRKEFRARENDPFFRDLNVQARGTAFSLAIETIRRLNVLDRIINLALVDVEYSSLGSGDKGTTARSV